MRVAWKEVGLRLGVSVEVTAANVPFSYSGGSFGSGGRSRNPLRLLLGRGLGLALLRAPASSFAVASVGLLRQLLGGQAPRVLVPPLSPLLGRHGGGPRTSRRAPRDGAAAEFPCYMVMLSLQDTDHINAETWGEENVPSGGVLLA